VQLGPDVTQS